MWGDTNGDELAKEHRLNQLYLAIISRYKDYIEEKEHISVAELPTLVNPRDELVAKKAQEIKLKYGEYSYEEDFYDASVDAFMFVRDQVETVSMPLEFWLTPSETIEFRVGDIMDRNALLCSLLIALGNQSTKVLVVVRDTSRKVICYYELDKKFYVMDLGDGTRSYESAEKIKDMFGAEGATAYEFNDKLYMDIS